MYEGLETLIALSEAGTMTRTALRMRVSQSTISKRIAALEAEVGAALVEPEGRRVRLTPRARALVSRATPLLRALGDALAAEPEAPGGRISIGVSESILSSWGAKQLERASRAVPGLELDLHAHRSPVAIDRVRAGEYHLALVAGRTSGWSDLVARPLLDEAMVIVPAGLKPLRLSRRHPVQVIAIESHAETWSSLRGGIARLRRERGLRIEVMQRLESFAGIVQMARAGFGHGLVPEGIARALGVSDSRLISLPRPGLARPVHLLARQRTWERPLADALHASLCEVVTR
jgi:DNA-binding transcriptional LysR family regulator